MGMVGKFDKCKGRLHRSFLVSTNRRPLFPVLSQLRAFVSFVGKKTTNARSWETAGNSGRRFALTRKLRQSFDEAFLCIYRISPPWSWATRLRLSLDQRFINITTN
ncbi:hypothetical protein DdX_09745 [Ditylenchus destructor]|uniref:Uncharacterized protein n=1 Tax=Ditylenchus destructor TaxID=166010 RepID=A0AAD4R678_9BILA|nr:hypothetical protein DdX_09745 [Ditylenchus destructor]